VADAAPYQGFAGSSPEGRQHKAYCSRIANMKLLLVMLLRLPAVRRWKKIRRKSRPELYNILYKLPWGYTVFNNYGFAPAETHGPERFQLQLYGELTKLLKGSGGRPPAKHMLEISCGRGGGFCHLIDFLPVESQRLAWISRSMPLDTAVIVTPVARMSRLCAGMPCVCRFRTAPSMSW
jgi:hypothetical protein